MTLTTTISVKVEVEVEVEIEVDDERIESVDLRSAVMEELPIPQDSKLHQVIQDYLSDHLNELEDIFEDELKNQSESDDE